MVLCGMPARLGEQYTCSNCRAQHGGERLQVNTLLLIMGREINQSLLDLARAVDLRGHVKVLVHAERSA